jgi:HPr Serine kinase C-terminal domain
MIAVSPEYSARAFGLIWHSDIDTPYFRTADINDIPPDVVILRTAQLKERRVVHSINRGFVYADGFRFEWNDIATFDVFDGDRVEYLPGPEWVGTLPWPFYSTVAALLLAWRGAIPFHGCAVAIDGQGLLICGESGAGKSSLTSALVAMGARFLSDDLSVIVPDADGPGWTLTTGRPGIRLFPSTGKWFFGNATQAVVDDHRDKVIAVPAESGEGDTFPVRQIIFLGQSQDALTAIDRFILLRKNLFRPKWLAKLPNSAATRVAVRDVSASTMVRIEPPVGETSEHQLRQRAIAIIDTMRSEAHAAI